MHSILRTFHMRLDGNGTLLPDEFPPLSHECWLETWTSSSSRSRAITNVMEFARRKSKYGLYRSEPASSIITCKHNELYIFVIIRADSSKVLLKLGFQPRCDHRQGKIGAMIDLLHPLLRDEHHWLEKWTENTYSSSWSDAGISSVANNDKMQNTSCPNRLDPQYQRNLDGLDGWTDTAFSASAKDPLIWKMNHTGAHTPPTTCSSVLILRFNCDKNGLHHVRVGLSNDELHDTVASWKSSWSVVMAGVLLKSSSMALSVTFLRAMSHQFKGGCGVMPLSGWFMLVRCCRCQNETMAGESEYNNRQMCFAAKPSEAITTVLRMSQGSSFRKAYSVHIVTSTSRPVNMVKQWNVSEKNMHP